LCSRSIHEKGEWLAYLCFSSRLSWDYYKNKHVA
jgi:hypothetical protein